MIKISKYSNVKKYGYHQSSVLSSQIYDGSISWCVTSYVIVGKFFNISMILSSLTYKMTIISVLEGCCED